MTTPPEPNESPVDLDAGVVDELVDCVAGAEPKSFFLFAGAGSGKTYTLVSLLQRLIGAVEADQRGAAFGARLRAAGQTIAVITYTRNAADQVRNRLGDSPLVTVSTIHSFLWRVIQPHQAELRAELIERADRDVAEAQQKLDAKREKLATRAGKPTKAGKASAAGGEAATRDPTAAEERAVETAKRKQTRVEQATQFIYMPEAGRPDVGALTHAEVLDAGCALLEKQPLLGRLLMATHPLVLIDESQDTNKHVLARMLKIGADFGLRLGLIGDHRQRIYLDGEPSIIERIPESWAKPRLQYNRRCPTRIVRLINEVWHSEIDGRRSTPSAEHQHPLPTAADGAVRVYIGHADEPDKPAAERRCAEYLAAQLADQGWRHHAAPGAPGGYQLLTITHQLGAERGGFAALYEALAVLRGDGARSDAEQDPEPLLHLFRLSQCQGDDFAAMNLLREVSPVFRLTTKPEGACAAAAVELAPVRGAVDELRKAWRDSEDPPTIGRLLDTVSRGRLFSLDEFEGAGAPVDVDLVQEGANAEAIESNKKLAKRRKAVRDLLGCAWSEYPSWRAYLEGSASYATHQGVKGSEFDRVMVVIDDRAAKYALFSFEKLLGSAELSSTDRKSLEDGRDTTIDRTLRLLYVTCSRAKNSLALVIWTADPAKVRDTLLRMSWFEDAELLSVPEA